MQTSARLYKRVGVEQRYKKERTSFYLSLFDYQRKIRTIANLQTVLGTMRVAALILRKATRFEADHVRKSHDHLSIYHLKTEFHRLAERSSFIRNFGSYFASLSSCATQDQSPI